MGCSPEDNNFSPGSGDETTGRQPDRFGNYCPYNFEYDEVNDTCICPIGNVRFNPEGCILWDDPSFLYTDLPACVGDGALLIRFNDEFKHFVDRDGFEFERKDLAIAAPNYSGGFLSSGGGADYLNLSRDGRPDSIIFQMEVASMYLGQDIGGPDEYRGTYLNWSGNKINDSLYIGTVKFGYYDTYVPINVHEVFAECPDTLRPVRLR